MRKLRHLRLSRVFYVNSHPSADCRRMVCGELYVSYEGKKRAFHGIFLENGKFQDFSFSSHGIPPLERETLQLAPDIAPYGLFPRIRATTEQEALGIMRDIARCIAAKEPLPEFLANKIEPI